MRQSKPLNALESNKADYIDSVTQSLFKVHGMRSVTFTGSFVEKKGLGGISDIDVVIIVDSLSQTCFFDCHSAVAATPTSLLGLPNHRLCINDTFGPLKFDESGVVVVHMMVYDLAGHREHVIKSPFTCLDWERSPYFFGPSLRDLYPVIALFPRQFLDARRSLNNYLDDLAAGSISFRRYEFLPDGCLERVERLDLDPRHQGEYAFHIINNLVSNYAKLLTKQNRRLSENEVLVFWQDNMPSCIQHIEWFKEISAIKQERGGIFPSDTLSRTREFITAFADHLHDTWHRRATRHIFVRHGKTTLNDGSFLGQRRDPSIINPPPTHTSLPSRIISSPAIRCRETATALAPFALIEVDSRLHEIDYGSAEGLSYSKFRTEHPEMVDAWARHEDPRFPGGENTNDVYERLHSFINSLDQRPSLVVTHNVVLRCLVGAGLNIPRHQWYLITVEHLEDIALILFDGQSYLDLTPKQVTRITDALVSYPHEH